MKYNLIVLAALAMASCSSSGERSADEAALDTALTPIPIAPLAHATAFHLLDLPNLEDNIRNDTLLIYTIHELGDGTFILAGKNVEDNREGLRLIQYHPRPDSSAEVLAVSKPAYDSQVMLPTYFASDDTADGTIILANYGGVESWGQNVFWLKDHQFTNLGWLDIAEHGWKTRFDSLQQWRTNIGPKTAVSGADGQFEFAFTTDSLQLFDDLQGGIEVVLPSNRVKYRYDGDEMVLIVDGKPRYRKKPL